MTILNEKEFIRLLQDPQSQREAFEKVVQTYSEPLYRQIRRMVLNHDDANDVLQNTFLKAWTNIEYFRGDAKLSTWLYRIAINESLTFLSRQQAQQSLTIDELNEARIEELSGDPFFDGDAAQIALQKAIHTLPEKQRVVFQMKYFEEMKYEDISDIVGTSVGALKASYHHAVKKIEDFFNLHF